jgi:hypothetical protein
MTRRGSTLLELALSIPILVFLMVLLIGSMRKGMDLYKIAKQRANVSQSLARFERQIRSDARVITQASLGNAKSPNGLSMHTIANSVIEYVSHRNEIRRTVTHADGSTHFDSFALFDESLVEWFVDEPATTSSGSTKTSVAVQVWRVLPLDPSVKRLELSVKSPIGRFAVGSHIAEKEPK